MINYSAAIALAVLVIPEGSRSFFFVVLHQVQYLAIVVLKQIRWKVLNNKTYEDSGRDSMYIIDMEQEQTSAGFVLQRRASSISSTQP